MIEPPKYLNIHYELEKWLTNLWNDLEKTYTLTINPASVNANTTSEQTFALTGVTTTDIITITKPTHTTGLGIVNARATKDNIHITFMNNTVSPIDPPSEAYLIGAKRT